MPVRSPHFTTLTAASACWLLFAGSASYAADPEPARTAAADAAPADTTPATPAASDKASAGTAPATPAPAVTAGAVAAVVELPSFQPGLWQYRRTFVTGQSPKPQVSTIRKCTDPGADIREKMEQLKKKNCQFAPLKRSKDTYISSWVCQTPTGVMRFRDVLIVKDPASYQDVSETHSSQHVTEQKIEATRLGECPGGAEPARQ